MNIGFPKKKIKVFIAQAADVLGKAIVRGTTKFSVTFTDGKPTAVVDTK